VGVLDKMKRILIIFIASILIISTIGAIALGNKTIESKQSMEIIENINFYPIIIIKDSEEYIEVKLDNTETYHLESGRPVLPKVIKNLEIPFGARNIRLDIKINDVSEHDIIGKIRPASIHLPKIALDDNIDFTDYKDEVLYNSESYYPSEWYNFRIGCGLNSENQIVTHIVIHFYPVRYSPSEDKVLKAGNAIIEIEYDNTNSDPIPKTSEYDLVIIAPSEFSEEINRLIDHKNSYGIETTLKTIEDIYNEYEGRDKPEEVKYFIKDAIENLGIKYVLLIGGLKSIFYGNPRENRNYGAKDWHVPVRYNNFYDHPEHPLLASSIYDPGVISDLYYADIYKEGGLFNDWDPNGDGIIAAWGMENVENDTGLDMFPDVSLGRLACRNEREVRTVVDKIINYEKTQCDPTWFKRAIMISGDGFLDQEDLDFIWDTNGLADGLYTIFAQSKNPEGDFGPIDEIPVTIDKTQETKLSFNHDDHLKIDSYPAPPIAEIVTVSPGDIIGNTDFKYEPNEGRAYCNEFSGWANMEYTEGILHIRGKTYDPKPYGYTTDIHVWIENSQGEIVFDDWRFDSEMYFEGEWVTGEKLLQGSGGAAYYLPDDFKNEIFWASNGKLTGRNSCTEALSEGWGFAFLSGHGSPNSWGDHYPGVPGNRGHGSFGGLTVTTLRPWPPFVTPPAFPMEKIQNNNKLPVTLIGGCHNSQFNVSMITGLLDYFLPISMWCYGTPVPECSSWYLVKMPEKGAIATIGNTGLGYGVLGRDCTIDGLDGGICIEFFRQYGEYDQHVLGDAYTQTLRSYVQTFDMDFLDHAKSLVQWVLLGDPSLMIGGYA
jgi:hypothetical protein